MQSQTAALNMIEKIVREEGIDCNFRRLDGYLMRGKGWERKDMQEEMEACKRAGFSEIKLLQRFPNPVFVSEDCIHFTGQGTFHPLKYLYALANLIVERGGQILEGAHAKGFSPIKNNGDKDLPTEKPFLKRKKDKNKKDYSEHRANHT